MSKIQTIAAFAAGATTALTLTTGIGCQQVNTRNDPAFVESADRFVNTTVGPHYESLLDAELAANRLTPLQVESHKANVTSFRDAVNQAMTETGETAATAVP